MKKVFCFYFETTDDPAQRRSIIYLQFTLIPRFCSFYYQTVITETSREDSTWILDGEVTDRSALGEEADSFCAQYKMYRVKKMQESLRVTEIQTKGKKIAVKVV